MENVQQQRIIDGGDTGVYIGSIYTASRELAGFCVLDINDRQIKKIFYACSVNGGSVDPRRLSHFLKKRFSETISDGTPWVHAEPVVQNTFAKKYPCIGIDLHTSNYNLKKLRLRADKDITALMLAFTDSLRICHSDVSTGKDVAEIISKIISELKADR
jgi:hypothetical protein